MTVFKKKLTLTSHGGTPTFINITEELRAAIAESGIAEGTATVISPHTTCAVFFEEFVHDVDETGTEFLQNDLNAVLEKLIPNQTGWNQYQYPGEEHYRAVKSWPDAEAYLPGGDRTALWNCDAHLKATLIGSSETFEVADGKLAVGTTGYCYFVDFDRTRARTRKCTIIVMGEEENIEKKLLHESKRLHAAVSLYCIECI